MTKNSSGLGLDTVGDLSDFLDASAGAEVNH
jgi:ParB family chromosome partitioning protein